MTAHCVTDPVAKPSYMKVNTASSEFMKYYMVLQLRYNGRLYSALHPDTAVPRLVITNVGKHGSAARERILKDWLQATATSFIARYSNYQTNDA